MWLALSAILQTLSPNTAAEATANGNGSKLSADHVRTLSDKLGQILGDQAEDGEPSTRNDKGEVRPFSRATPGLSRTGAV